MTGEQKTEARQAVEGLISCYMFFECVLGVVLFWQQAKPASHVKSTTPNFSHHPPLLRDFGLLVVLFRGVHAIAAPIQDTQHRGVAEIRFKP